MTMRVTAAIALAAALAGCGSSSNPGQPDLGPLLSPQGSDACAETAAVPGGALHVLTVSHLRQQALTTCDVSEQLLKLASPNSVKLEHPGDIRGKLMCSIVNRPYGTDSDQVIKAYVFVDGTAMAGNAAKPPCDNLRHDLPPTAEFHQYN